MDVTAVRGSQLTYCVEVAAELLADVEEQTVRSVYKAQRPRRESPNNPSTKNVSPVEVTDGGCVMFFRRWVPGIALMAGFVGCGTGGDRVPAAVHPEGTEAYVSVSTQAARRGIVSEAVDGLGRVEALPDHLATLTPAVEGHVQALLVKQGAWVKKGQPIVELNKAVALADLAEKTASRDTLRASLTLLKSLPRPEEQRPMVLAIEQAQVAYDRAKKVVDELRRLRASNLASQQQLFDAEKAVEAARIQLETAESQHHVHMIGPRPEAVAEGEAKIKTAEGLVEFSKAHLDFHTIRSPIDGVLDSLTCHPGQTISIGSPIGEVIDTRRVYATVWLSPLAARGVHVGQTARVRPAGDQSPMVEAAQVPDEGLTGKVDFVGQAADLQTSNLPIRVLVEKVEGRLPLGLIVQVTINRGYRKDVLQVPVAAVLDPGEGPVIEVVRQGKSVVLHPQVGMTHDGWVVVAGTDLKEGEEVIVEGGYSLPEGTPVKVVREDKGKALAQAEARR